VIKNEEVYFPKGTEWYDFWVGKKLRAANGK
jgi:alpha-glucosidase (family GH31 glycosyl hydrolase)